MNDKHTHDENCDCGHDFDAEDTIVITLDDDTELECQILGLFEVDQKEYISLLPVSDDEQNVLIYRYSEDKDEIVLDIIEDDDEFDSACEAFYSIVDEGEYEIEFEDDDEGNI